MTTSNLPNLCIIAGEASGDAQGALLIQALQSEFKFHSKNFTFWGVAGPHLLEEGVESILDIEDLSVLGVSEVVPKYMAISKAYKKILNEIKIRKPSAVLFIDYPGFNLRLLKDVYNLGITTIYHIPPKAWSHGEKRTEILKNYSYLVTSILPFEVDFFKARNVNIKFVGNPLKDSIDQFRKNNPKPKIPYRIAILPGSRESEIRRLLPILIEAFIELEKIDPRYEAHIPMAINVSKTFVQIILQEIKQKFSLSEDWFQRKIIIGYGNAYDVLNTSEYAWVCSGTASLETAFFTTPMSVLYKVSPLTELVARAFLKIKYVSLVNLCSNKEIVPEFLQKEANAKNLIDHALFIIKNKDAKEKMLSELQTIQDLFPQNAAKNAAYEIYKCIIDNDVSYGQKFHIHSKLIRGKME